jgi:hypothetical protein
VSESDRVAAVKSDSRRADIVATEEKIVDYLAEELKKVQQKREARHARMRKLITDLSS